MPAIVRFVARIVLLFAWALWLGGLFTVFLVVLALFRNDRSIFDEAAPRIFHTFEPYQCGLAAVAVISAAMVRQRALFILLVFASIGSLISPLWITPQITELQLQGQIHTEEFAKLHGLSMSVYTADAALLCVAGLLLAARNKPSH